ncbi:hypothetical protein JCM30237_01140 [Halolamina litorea]|jgi:predicted RNA-binding protein with TRAM domain|uniref:TRAM domain-containing protein n=1 Tax=Halolamina litorea TaxID=1515593 RepID=A0ABD6BT94_9EURY|nr:hypothetical protein [Halolamina litorea]
MVTPSPLVIAAVAAIVSVAAYGGYRKGKADGVVVGKQRAERQESREAHEDAMEREPPVSVGDSVSLGVKEFKSHHSGERVAVCKQEGFVIFVEGVPESVDVGDVIDAEIVDFGHERNSAEAQYTG